jgi:hypothetical protein
MPLALRVEAIDAVHALDATGEAGGRRRRSLPLSALPPDGQRLSADASDGTS